MKNLLPLSFRRAVGGWWHHRKERAAKQALLRRLRGSGTTCNVCGWEGALFADDCWHPGTICPECGSQVRHRLLTAAFDHLPGLTMNEIIEGKRILHFAPERQLRTRVAEAAGRYVSADYDRGDVDWKLDISRMPEVPDAEFDVVICCDVLEHVPDDAGAYREIHRVLAPGGLAILSVPQRDKPAITDEDLSITSPEERLRRFGQHDHVRMFGQDFSDRLRQAGFAVREVTEADFAEDLQKCHVLMPPQPGQHPLATNQRRIYFCTAPPA